MRRAGAGAATVVAAVATVAGEAVVVVLCISAGAALPWVASMAEATCTMGISIAEARFSMVASIPAFTAGGAVTVRVITAIMIMAMPHPLLFIRVRIM